MERDIKPDLRSNLFVLSAPSATGKNTVFDLLKTKLPNIRRVITATTRAHRNREINGIDYHFMTESEFMQRVEAGEFVEHNLYDSGYYGTPVEEIEACPENIPLFLIVDTNGMRQVIKKYPNANSIFLMPPSIEELERRIRSRGDNTQEQIENRISQARAEIECAEAYDHVVVNDDLDKCVDHILSIVKETSLL